MRLWSSQTRTEIRNHPDHHHQRCCRKPKQRWKQKKLVDTKCPIQSIIQWISLGSIHIKVLRSWFDIKSFRIAFIKFEKNRFFGCSSICHDRLDENTPRHRQQHAYTRIDMYHCIFARKKSNLVDCLKKQRNFSIKPIPMFIFFFFCCLDSILSSFIFNIGREIILSL